MWFPEELKVNKFVDVHLPDNMTYFSRFGMQSVGQQFYTGDDVAVLEGRKVDDLQAYQKYAEMMAQQEYDKSEK